MRILKGLSRKEKKHSRKHIRLHFSDGRARNQVLILINTRRRRVAREELEENKKRNEEEEEEKWQTMRRRKIIKVDGQVRGKKGEGREKEREVKR